MPPNEMERIGRMEEKINGIHEDVTEIKINLSQTGKDLNGTVREFTTALSKLHEDFLLRREAEKLIEQRDKERDDAKREVEQLKYRVSKLENWRAWLTGGLGIITFVVGVIVALIRDGVLK